MGHTVVMHFPCNFGKIELIIHYVVMNGK
jgi:hypothetical protein